MVKQRRRWATPIAVVACAVLVAACGGDDDSEAGKASTTASGGDDAVSVGLILDAPANSQAWTKAAAEALERMQSDGLIDLTIVDSVTNDASSLKQAATQMAEDGTELIIAHTGEWGEPIREFAVDYPDTNFAYTGAEPSGGNTENVAAIGFPMYQGAYLAGILAGGITESGVIGGTAGFDIPVCHAMLEAFGEGAKSVRPDVRMIPSYIGSWTDQEKIKEATLASADQGADVFVPCGTDPATIAGAKERDLSVFGYVIDEASLAPKNVTASLMWDLEVPFRQMVEDLHADKFRPAKTYVGGVAEGSIKLQLNPDYAREIPEETLAAYEKAEEQIKSGELEIPFVGK